MVRVIDNTEGRHGLLPVAQTVERIIQSFAPDQLWGLGSVVVSRHSLQPRSHRLHWTKARGRRVLISECAGLYHQAWKGDRAWIELFADAMMLNSPRWLLRRRFIQDAVVGSTFFHEFGHHLHATCAREYREKENVAEEWSDGLLMWYLGREYAWFRPMSLMVKWSGLRRIIAWGGREYARRRMPPRPLQPTAVSVWLVLASLALRAVASAPSSPPVGLHGS